MKKLSVILLAFLLMLTICACASQAAPVSEEKAAPPVEYQLKAGETSEVHDKTFDSEVIVRADDSLDPENRPQIVFVNCHFKKGVTFNGDRNARLIIEEGCVFENESCITVTEATKGSMKTGTLDDPFLQVFAYTPNVRVESTALVNVISNQPSFTLNGTEYQMADFPDCNVFCIAPYYENGQLTVFTDGWTE